MAEGGAQRDFGASEHQLLFVSLVQYVDFLIFAGVLCVPKLMEAVLILDPGFTLIT